MNPVFKLKENQKLFDELGYVVIDLFSANDIQQLESIYNKYFEYEEVGQFISTNIMNSLDWRLSVANDIKAIISDKLNQVLKDVTFWHPAFLIKPVGVDTEFELHQDWTFVDEEKYYSGNIWIPTKNTDFNNGTLCIIPKTHFKYTKTYRSHNMEELFKEFKSEFKKYAVPIEVKAGQMVVFQHSLIHYTPSNLSPTKRIAVSCGFNSRNTNVIAYNRKKNGRVDIHLMNSNYVFYYTDASEVGHIPENAIIIGHLEYEEPQRELKEVLHYFRLP